MGYPHRSTGDLDMQNRLARFLYSADIHPEIRDTLLLPEVMKLADTVATVNAQFLASKVIYRTRLVNVFANATKLGIHKASESFIKLTLSNTVSSLTSV